MPDTTIVVTTRTVECKFYNNSSVLFDPTTVTVTVTDPAGANTTYDFATAPTYSPVGLTKTSTGIYVLKYDFTMRGIYRFKWYGATPGSTGGKITVESHVTIGD